jgi:hypothetical protein
MIRMPTHDVVRPRGRIFLTGFKALSGLEPWHAAAPFAGGAGSMATFAWRCTG